MLFEMEINMKERLRPIVGNVKHIGLIGIDHNHFCRSEFEKSCDYTKGFFVHPTDLGEENYQTSSSLAQSARARTVRDNINIIMMVDNTRVWKMTGVISQFDLVITRGENGNIKVIKNRYGRLGEYE